MRDSDLETHRPMLRRLARRFASRHRLDADDACQVALVAAWRALQAGCEPRPPLLARAAWNAMIDELRTGRWTGVTRAGRSHGLDRPASLNAPLADGGELQDLLEDPADPIAAAELRLLLRDALGRLRPRERFVLVSRYQHDLPQQQIAEMLGVSPSRVTKLRDAALEKLRRQLT
jgi:RNA polymerase sigma factor (sigma-70 family)